METAIVFYILALAMICFAYKVVSSVNPIHSALFLVLTMIDLAFIFFTLNAQFIAGVQMVVYAGAVMVLFVMVLMLFDLKTELRAFSRGAISGVLKIGSAALLAGLLIGIVRITTDLLDAPKAKIETVAQTQQMTRELAAMLFSKYIFAFETLGVLLLIVAVGAVAISRVKGGTHARH